MLEVRGPKPDFDNAFRQAANTRVNALVIARHGLLTTSTRNRLSTWPFKNRLPSMFEATDTTDAGGLMSYSASDADSFLPRRRPSSIRF